MMGNKFCSGHVDAMRLPKVTDLYIWSVSFTFHTHLVKFFCSGHVDAMRLPKVTDLYI